MKNTSTISETQTSKAMLSLAVIPIGIATNLAIGTIVNALKLPIFMDAVGTIIVVLLLGWKAGMTVGVLSFMLGGILTNPVLPWFSGTQAAIAVFIYLMASKGLFRDTKFVIMTGILLGVVCAIASAPVIAYFFGGVTGSGRSFITAWLIKSGETIIRSTFLSGFAVEPIDKTLQCLLAVLILKTLPKSLLCHFRSDLLRKNGFTNDQ